MTGFSSSGGDRLRVGFVLWDSLRGRPGSRGALSPETGAQRLALPYSFSVMVSYYGLVLDLQNLGSDIFLLQVLFGAVDLLGRATVTFFLRFFGRRTILAVSLVMAGLSILANVLVPQGEASGKGDTGALASPAHSTGASGSPVPALRQAQVDGRPDRGGEGAKPSRAVCSREPDAFMCGERGASPGPPAFL